jgi:hypothetical protein
MTTNNVHDTIPCPPPEDACGAEEQERLEHLNEQIELYQRAAAGKLTGDPKYTTIGGRRQLLEAA